METSKAVATADLNAHNHFGKWAQTGEGIEEPFEQTVDPSQLNFDFPQFESQKGDGNEDESGGSESSRSSSESYGEIDDNVLVEMRKLENIFQNIGLNFRMIDRIGEGEERN